MQVRIGANLRGQCLNKITKLLVAGLTGSAALTIQCLAAPAAAPAKGPGTPDRFAIERVGGHPNFSGVWSVMNTANWDIEPHLAKAALELRAGPVVSVPAKAVVALGAVGSVPAGLGVVEGGKIPYTAQALAKRQENQAHYLERDPEV